MTTIPIIMVIGLAVSGCAPAGPSPATATRVVRPDAKSAALEDDVVEIVNRHRRGRGLPPLTTDPRIAEQARLHSAAMASGRTSLGHAGFSDRVASLARVMVARRTAENVAMNQGHRDPAAEAVRGWLRSRGHRENIEGPYELTGVGAVTNARGETYFTQIFAGR